MNISRNDVLSAIWASLDPVKLTHEINHPEQIVNARLLVRYSKACE